MMRDKSRALTKARRRQAADEVLKARSENWPDAVTPISRLMVRVFRFSRLIIENSTRQVGDSDLTSMEFDVLATLRGAPPPHELTPTDLYDAVLISSGGLTKVLRGLEKRNLVARCAAGADRRNKPVRLTAKGRGLAERVMQAVLRSDKELILSALSEAEVERLIRLLHKLLYRLESGEPVVPEPRRSSVKERPRKRGPNFESRSPMATGGPK